jgi:four helix bundle protein
MIKSYKDLTVWQKAHQLTLDVYRITKSFPDEEKFGLISQIRRAAVSVPANIVEGFRRKGKRDKVNFYNYSQSSLDELDYEMLLANDLGYYNEYSKINGKIDEVARILSGLISSVTRSKA